MLDRSSREASICNTRGRADRAEDIALDAVRFAKDSTRDEMRIENPRDGNATDIGIYREIIQLRTRVLSHKV